jgi:hypothetical protein
VIKLHLNDNFELIINETKGIEEFGKEHSVGIGFTDSTIVGENSVKIINKIEIF